MTLAGMEDSAVETELCIRSDRIFINTEWQAFETSRSRTSPDIDPVLPPHESSVIRVHHRCHQQTKHLSAKRKWIDWVWSTLGSITSKGIGPPPKPPHLSLLHLWYQFSITVKSKNSWFPVKQLVSLCVWQFCDLSENTLNFSCV